MLKVAVAAFGPALDQLVPERFEDTVCLLIVDAETDAILDVVEGTGEEPLAQSLFFSQKVADFDCEAILCGELEQQAFAVLAEENCITRYLASGLGVQESIHLMNAYALPLITDYVGGSGCPDNDPANCAHDHDHDHGHGHDHGVDCDGDCNNCAERGEEVNA